MTSLDLLLGISLLTNVLMLVTGKSRASGWLAVILYAAQLIVLGVMGKTLIQSPDVITTSLHFSVLGNSLSWSMTGFGWFFAIITVGSALLTTWFAAGAWSAERDDRRIFHTAMAVNVFTMLLLLCSGDLLSLFIGWELVSWASYLMMAQRGGTAIQSALRYIIYATAGAMAILAGILLIHSHTGAFDYASTRSYLSTTSPGMMWTLMLLFAVGFLIKMAAVPFHLWQAKAYSLTPGPGAAFLGAISSRMGLFGFVILFISLLGPQRMIELNIPYTFLNSNELWMWISVITIVVPTYIALTQSDARMLLAWHGIGQGGYMLVGILVGSPLGVAGGLLHVFNYATYQAALFLAVTAVAYRTGTTDLDRLGGLVTRMPWTFVVMLLGIIGLAGLPPMNGFVSKWMVYKSLLNNGMPLLFLATVIGTLGTILSVYKLIHNTFLGQLRLEHEAVREVPLSMTIPMLILGAIAFITGYLPGLALDLVAPAQAYLKVPPLSYSLGGIQIVSGSLNMLWVVSIMIVSIGIGALIFFAGNRSSRVHQFDNYAGGHFLTSDMRYHYSHNFYPGLMRVIGSWYRGSIQWLESGLVSISNVSASVSAAVYRSAYVSYYLLLTVLVALLWVVVS